MRSTPEQIHEEREMMKNIRQEIQTKLEKHVSDDKFYVDLLWIGEPATEEQFASVEKMLGMPLDPAIRSFYSQCNGIHFRGYPTEKPGHAGQVRSQEPGDWGEIMDDYDTCWITGDPPSEGTHFFQICIPTIEEMFLSEDKSTLADWSCVADPDVFDDDDTVELLDRVYPARQFYESLHLLDGFSGYHPIMLWADRKNGEFWVVAGDDQGACFDEYAPITFEAYIANFLTHDFNKRVLSEDTELMGPEY